MLKICSHPHCASPFYHLYVLIPIFFVAAVPDPPAGRIRVHKLAKDRVELDWSPPRWDGGRPIMGYVIDFREGDQLYWHRAATCDALTCQANVVGLTEGHEYLFRVMAFNEIGESDPLEVDLAIMPQREAEAPSMPGGPLVVTSIMKHSMTIAWQPPVSDGGSVVTSYIIEKRDSQAFSAWSRVDRVKAHRYTYTVTNLKAGGHYMFRVIAENARGRSKPLETHAPAEARSPYGKHE